MKHSTADSARGQWQVKHSTADSARGQWQLKHSTADSARGQWPARNLGLPLNHSRSSDFTDNVMEADCSTSCKYSP